MNLFTAVSLSPFYKRDTQIQVMLPESDPAGGHSVGVTASLFRMHSS